MRPRGSAPPAGTGVGQRFDRRTGILGAGCFALAALRPMSARAGPLPRQSPIDLRRDVITFVKRLPRIVFAYPRRVDVTLRNTGAGEFDTVRAELPDGAAHMSSAASAWTSSSSTGTRPRSMSSKAGTRRSRCTSCT
jgi:hypothetical protein